MQLGMIGLGRMGANMVRRLQRAGHSCVAYDLNQDAVAAAEADGAVGAADLAALVEALEPPRHVWIMVPAAFVDSTVEQLRVLLHPLAQHVLVQVKVTGGLRHRHAPFPNQSHRL